MQNKVNGLNWPVVVVTVVVVGLASACNGSGQATVPPAAATSPEPTATGLTFQIPKDIPIYLQNTDLAGSDTDVSYDTNASLTDLVVFYEQAMPKNGWTRLADPAISSGRT